MFHEVANIVKTNIDEICKQWVDDLRRTGRTEVHKNMLTAEIVDSTKVVLVNFAQAIDEQELPEGETIPLVVVKTPGDVPMRRMIGTRPLAGPLALAQQAAIHVGKKRHEQNYELHEVVVEWIKLRQHIWTFVHEGASQEGLTLSLDLVQYMDRLFDELMLTVVESYYDASVRDLQTRAVRDPLTHLFNKDYFVQRLHQELRRALRYGEQLTLVMIDMDRLKEINDTFGHPAGDTVITTVARTIRDTGRQADVACRVGGDEFAVILPETDKSQGVIFADRVMAALNKLHAVVVRAEAPAAEPTITRTIGEDENRGDSALPLVVAVPSLSIGLASFPEDARNPEMLIARADAALYRAKREGRNRVAS